MPKPQLPPALDADFVLGAVSERQFPEPLGFELAFLGRSNCGKSTLLNYFLGRKGLARVSSTPGRTREINFFKVTLSRGASPFWVADLPGYGFASAPKAMVEGWRGLVESYLSSPRGQKALLLMDVRRSLATEETMLLDLLDHLSVPSILVATKCDKLTRSQAMAKERDLKEGLAGRAPLVLSSALDRLGREELMLAALPPECLGEAVKFLPKK
jgi:GTP-binding protein